ncbi:MAG: family 10 glycosylhydrolase, partial [Duncaniella sp.]|nr:family 10 glycosylhydrolase [Duncaniella sp.]
SDRLKRDKGWLLTHGKYTVLNPGLEEVREYVTDVCREIATGYDIDGLIFDDYFYPNRIPEGPDSPDYQLYLSQAPWMSQGDWRRTNIHKAVADVRCMLTDTKPEVRFGISPAGVTGKGSSSASRWGRKPLEVKADVWQYNEIYSDPLAWLHQGTVDFVSPQIYWPTTHSTAPYSPIASWWSEIASLSGCHFYPSVTLEKIETGDLATHRRELACQITHNRATSTGGTQGTMIYSAKFLPKVQAMLADDLYTYPVLTPRVLTPHDLPLPPQSLKLHNGTLSWTPPAGTQPRRYTVYAVPSEVSREEAVADDRDGIDAAFLIGVTYEPSMNVGHEKGFRYAVCTYSGYSTESAPAWLN